MIRAFGIIIFRKLFCISYRVRYDKMMGENLLDAVEHKDASGPNEVFAQISESRPTITDSAWKKGSARIMEPQIYEGRSISEIR